MHLYVVILIFILSSASAAWSQPKMSTEQLAAYNKPDREKLLYAGAKAEGKVTWYTSLAGDSYKKLAAAYEAKYPGVSVESYRATRQEMSARILAESQAQRYIADTMETTIPLLKLLKDSNWLVPYYFSTIAKYPDNVKEKAPKGLVYWAIDRESPLDAWLADPADARPLGVVSRGAFDWGMRGTAAWLRAWGSTRGTRPRFVGLDSPNGGAAFHDTAVWVRAA